MQSNHGGASMPGTLFNQRTGTDTFPIDLLPEDLLIDTIRPFLGTDLSTKELSSLLQVNKSLYAQLYVPMKQATIKHVLALMKKDQQDTVEKIIQANPKLLLKKDDRDPKGLAYKDNILPCTPYQAALENVFNNNMWKMLEKYFPGKSRAEKLQYAAIQAQEHENTLRAEYVKLDEIMQQTNRAFRLYLAADEDYCNILDEDSFAMIPQAEIDAWLRIGKIQREWPGTLIRLFCSTYFSERNFTHVPVNLPEAKLYDENDDEDEDNSEPWFPLGNDNGCDLLLKAVPEGTLPDFSREAKTVLDDDHFVLIQQPMLIQQGDHYFIYGSFLEKDKEQIEWKVASINAKPILEAKPIIEFPAINEPAKILPYSPDYIGIYSNCKSIGVSLGQGLGFEFSATRCSNNGAYKAEGWEDPIPAGWCGGIIKEINALYKMRTEELNKKLEELKQYYPEKKTLNMNPAALILYHADQLKSHILAMGEIKQDSEIDHKLQELASFLVSSSNLNRATVTNNNNNNSNESTNNNSLGKRAFSSLVAQEDSNKQQKINNLHTDDHSSTRSSTLLELARRNSNAQYNEFSAQTENSNLNINTAREKDDQNMGVENKFKLG